MDDRELLSAFAKNRSDEAFGELVARHRDWVYSVCLRRSHDAAMAEDATQVVFLALAQKAEKLAGKATIVGWLHTVARYTTSKMRRSDARRKLRERKAGNARNSNPAGESQARQTIQCVIEPAMDALGARDRQAVLLRYYRQLSLAEIGAALAISEEAAKKRVNRGLDRLRNELARRGVGSVHGAMGAAVLAHVVTPAPPSVAAALQGISHATASAKIQALVQGVLQMMGFGKAVLAISACLVGLLVATAVAVPMIHRASAPVPGMAPIAAPAPATEPAPSILVAQQRQLAAAKATLQALDMKMKIVSPTPEFLMLRQDCVRRVAKLELSLAGDDATKRNAAVQSYLALTQDFRDAIVKRVLVDADPVAVDLAEEYVAEAETMALRVKTGEKAENGYW